jgi:hypothetical protein
MTPPNASSRISATSEGIRSLFKLEQLQKAKRPIAVTNDGICTAVKLEHPAKA